MSDRMVEAVAGLIRAVEFSLRLHVVVEDGNVDDGNLAVVLERGGLNAAELACLLGLRGLSEDQRDAAVEIAYV
jgi:hypothetical protein